MTYEEAKEVCDLVKQIKEMLKCKDPVKAVEALVKEHEELIKKVNWYEERIGAYESKVSTQCGSSNPGSKLLENTEANLEREEGPAPGGVDK